MNDKDLKYKILNKRNLFKKGFINVDVATVEFNTFSGDSITADWYSMDRSDVVAILLYHTEFEVFIFVEQFRYSCIGRTGGWTTEVVAGVMEESDPNAEECACRECVEEAGYRPVELKRVMEYMPSVGISNQGIISYYAEVDESNRVSEGGGLIHESEDIRIVKMTEAECKTALREGRIVDSKTILALHAHFATF